MSVGKFEYLNPFQSLLMLKNIEDIEKSKQYLVLFILQVLFWCNALALPLALYQDFIVRETFHNTILNIFLQVIYFVGCIQSNKGKWKAVFIIPAFILSLLAVLSQFINGPDSALILFYVLLLVLIQIVYSFRVTAISFMLVVIVSVLINTFRPENFNVQIGYYPVAVLHDYVAFFCCFIILIVMAFFVRQQTFLNQELTQSKTDLETQISETEQAKNALCVLNEDLEKRIQSATYELKLALEFAQASNKTKGEFLAKMSHEMRTPLNGILGFSQVLVENENKIENKEYGEAILQSAQHLLTIVNDILDVAKIENEKLELNLENFELNNLILELIQSVKSSAVKKDIEFNVVKPSQAHYLLGDQQKFKQILLHLLSNAIKFSDEGCVDLLVSVHRKQQDTLWVEVKVKDQGIGLAKDDINRIFEPFQQSDNSIRRRFGGTGLGLSIVKSYVECLNGTIEVNSVEAKGSEFIINLPFSVNKEKNNTIYKNVLSDELKNKLQNKEVLIVEDNPVNLKVALVLLKKLGVSCDVANDGQQALDEIAKKRFDLIFMDCQMPVLDGIEATKQIRHLDIIQPYIIALTANALESDKQNCFASGMNDFLAKPLQIKSLNRVLTDYLID